MTTGSSGDASALTWSLVIATYNRRDILPRCLELATRQSRPPQEIIVVDASPDWAATRAQVLDTLAVRHPHIRWEYVQARRRSLSAQRNQGVRLAHGNVLFLIDDDSLMYPDCAAQILRVYEADRDRQVAGVMADESPMPPDEKSPETSVHSPVSGARRRFVNFKDALLRRLGVLDYLLPYDERLPERPVPANLSGLNLLPRSRLHGAWMTFRRELVQREPFEEILDAYAYLEDCDVSYRLARHGHLVMAQDAIICHLGSPGGRLSRFTLATLGALNALVLHRLHSPSRRRSISLYRSFLTKQLLVEAGRDLARGDASLPRARGVLGAMRQFHKVFSLSEPELRSWYPTFQADLLRQDPSSGVRSLGYLVPEFPGQTHVFFWREVQALRQAGITVHLLSSRRPEPGACRHEFAAEAARQTHYLYPPRFPEALQTLLTRPFRTLKGLGYLLGLRESPWKKRLRNGGLLLCAADLVAHARQRGYRHVHVHSCADTAHVAALARILGGPRYSLTLHGDLPVYGTDHASKMTRATFVACVTAPLRTQVREKVGIPDERTAVLWMGVDTSKYEGEGEDRRTYQQNRLHLVTVARLNAMKGHAHALAAMRLALDQGYDFRYTIAGEGPHRAEIEAAIARLGLAERVVLAGTLSETAVRTLLQEADAFVLPSVGLGEAAPVSVMEAMASGLPVVASIIGGTPDMIDHGVDGLLVPQADEPKLADALMLLAGQPQERRRLGAAARLRAKRDFDTQSTARRLLDAIHRHAAE
jgi:glycosyltransferase involved in cell wall biosynthesis